VSEDSAEAPGSAPPFGVWADALLAERGLSLGDDGPFVELVYLGAGQLLAQLAAIDLGRLPFADLDFRRAPDNS
jgi:hypothetical protein